MLYRLDRVGEYLLALETGASRESAAPLLGLTPDRLELILKVGVKQLKDLGTTKLESSEMIYAGKGDAGRLALYTIQAEARCEHTLTQRMFNSSEHSWRAAQILLERRFPDRWGTIERMVAKGNTGGESGTQTVKLSIDGKPVESPTGDGKGLKLVK